LSPKEEKLAILKSESVSFDEKIDCFYCADNFFVLYKKGFEEVVGLVEEFSDAAEEVIKEIEDSGLIDGANIILDESKNSIRTLRKLASLAKSGNHKNFSSERIDKILSISDRLQLNINICDGKIVVKDSKDVDLLIKILDKYFVECMQTGDAYGSFAKTKLEAEPA
ncbi:MAG: DUF4868 domain-containing protein, partial [Flavobacteriaceae bacterium]|nr:DUF4868 domain-containing protein [Flavobacteriaceae bacterium]